MIVSRNQYYQIICPEEKASDVLDYVNKVEEFIPFLKKVFALEPSYSQLTVNFGNNGPHYEFGGVIKLNILMDLKDLGNIYGGLFHETIHGFLEKYIYREKGINELPEPCAIILQIAALDEINKEWADKFASGYGSSKDCHPLLYELVRIYKENGFNPIRHIYKELANSPYPILHKESLKDDLNRILKTCGVMNLINI